MTSARISLILFFRVMLFFHIGFSLAIAAEVCAILERIYDFDPSSDSVVSSSFPLTSICSCIPFELLVMSFVFSALISIP